MANFKAGNNNMQTLMRQAQKMQEEMEKTAELLDDWEVVGTAAGEAVVVYMNAKKIINGIELDESVVDPDDIEMLEDLILAAINDGYAKALYYKLASQLTFLDVNEGSGDGYDLDRIIEIAIDKGFDADKSTIDPDQWTKDELVAFAYASIGQFD